MPFAESAITTNTITLPSVLHEQVVHKIQERSIVASLSPSEPKIFGSEKYMYFTREPEAEYVTEGGEKHSTDFGISTISARPHKVQTTIRISDEAHWADEDGRTQILSAALDSMAGAMARAYDLGIIHGIDPLSGTMPTELNNNIMNAQNVGVVYGSNTNGEDIALDGFDKLPDPIIEEADINGIALDRSYAAELRKVRDPYTGTKMFPEIGLNLEPGTVGGIRSVTSSLVGAKKYLGEGGNRKIGGKVTGAPLAILGDWSAIKWGMVRDFAITTIPYGDPDGLGDLARYNMIAYRIEAVISWGIMPIPGSDPATQPGRIPFSILYNPAAD